MWTEGPVYEVLHEKPTGGIADEEHADFRMTEHVDERGIGGSVPPPVRRYVALAQNARGDWVSVDGRPAHDQGAGRRNVEEAEEWKTVRFPRRALVGGHEERCLGQRLCGTRDSRGRRVADECAHGIEGRRVRDELPDMEERPVGQYRSGKRVDGLCGARGDEPAGCLSDEPQEELLRFFVQPAGTEPEPGLRQ